MVKRLAAKQEVVVFFTIVGLGLVIGLVNPAFFTAGHLFNLINSSVVMGIFALGVLVVLLSGGIDVSFTAIAVFAFYSTVKFLGTHNFQGSLLVPFGMATLIGLGLGLVNGFFVSRLKLMTLIATLGTASVFRGFLLTFIGSTIYTKLPSSMVAFSRAYLVEVVQGRARYGLHAGILVLAACALLTWFLLNRTMLGRGIHALGGDRVAAERAGFRIERLQYFIYAFSGAIAGIAGIVHSSMARIAMPSDLLGHELNVIAAVVLGGARITGGKGTVTGALLGTFLVTMITQSLILLGIPSYWQQAVLGALILVGTALPALQAKRKEAVGGALGGVS